MTPREKYEKFVNITEEMVLTRGGELKLDELASEIYKSVDWFLDEKEINAIFKFLLNQTVKQYIRERQMMLGYKHIIFDKDAKVGREKAMALTQYDSSKYITNFKAVFNKMTPKQARDVKDISLYKAIPSWDSFSEREERVDNMVNRYGIASGLFRVEQKAIDLRDLYGLNSSETELVFYLFMDKKYTMQDAFEYVGSYVLRNDDEDRDDRLKEDLLNRDVQFLFFEMGYGFEDIYTILLAQYVGEFKRAIIRYDKQFFDYLLKFKQGTSNHTKDSFENLYKYYFDNKTEECTEYDNRLYFELLSYEDKETALKDVHPGLKTKQAFDKRKRGLLKTMGKRQNVDEDEEVDYPFNEICSFEDDEAYDYFDGFSDCEDDNEDDEYWVDYMYDSIDPDYDLASPLDEEYYKQEISAYKKDEEDYFDCLCDELAEIDDALIAKLTRSDRGFWEHKNLNVKSEGDKIIDDDLKFEEFLNELFKR